MIWYDSHFDPVGPPVTVVHSNLAMMMVVILVGKKAEIQDRIGYDFFFPPFATIFILKNYTVR